MKTYKQRTQSILEKAEKKEKRNKRIKTISVLSSVAAVLVAFNLVLFVPYTVGGVNIGAYRSSEYYSVIEQLYGLTYAPYKTNNFMEWFGSLGSKVAGGEAPTAPDDPATSGSNDYREVTLNQTDGVIEGDLFKRSDTHIYYLGYDNGGYDIAVDCTNGSEEIKVYKPPALVLRVYSVTGEDSELKTEYRVSVDDGVFLGGYANSREMFLSADLNTVTVLSPCYDRNTRTVYTMVVGIDVSDITNISELGRTYISGSYISSRVKDGRMTVVSNFSVRYNADFSDEAQFVPQVGELDALESLPISNIVCPDNASSAKYTVITMFDSGLEVTDAVALLSFSSDVYVSENNLFVTRSYIETVETHNEYQLTYDYDKSEIGIVPYTADGFGEPRSINASGKVLNRFCMDEYNGVLRVVTDVSIVSTSYTVIDENPYAGLFGSVRCNLYCYDIDTLEQIASVTDFAPTGEKVRSARFDGDTAYVCTALVSIAELTDPVFAFDLSDLDNITYKDTGTIPGYSMSLTKFTDDTLLGIGWGETGMLKIELYEQTENDVSPLTAYELNATISQNVKAHFIDAENGLVGLGVEVFDYEGAYDFDYESGRTYYKLLRFDGYKLMELATVALNGDLVDTSDSLRACVVDDYVYIIGNDDFAVKKLY